MYSLQWRTVIRNKSCSRLLHSCIEQDTLHKQEGVLAELFDSPGVQRHTRVTGQVAAGCDGRDLSRYKTLTL